MMLPGGVHVSMSSPVVAALAELYGRDEFCCLGRAEYGPGRCTCWREEYDIDQSILLETTTTPQPRPSMCDDCACRANSPERRGDDRYVHAGELDYVLAGDRPFHCHDGIRRVIGWRHATESTFVAVLELRAAAPELGLTDDDYRPPVVDDVPYQASGRPAFVCAGWAAHQAAQEAAQ